MADTGHPRMHVLTSIQVVPWRLNKAIGLLVIVGLDGQPIRKPEDVLTHIYHSSVADASGLE
jgi:hypothetical protein